MKTMIGLMALKRFPDQMLILSMMLRRFMILYSAPHPPPGFPLEGGGINGTGSLM
jgi:hypothetical protein